MKPPVMDASVLVVDDDEDFVAEVKTALEKSFSRVESARDRKEAIANLDKDKPDLILLEVLLGGEPKGLEICRALRGDARWSDVPILMVTAVDTLYGMNLKSYVGEDECLPAEGFIDKIVGVAEIVKRARSVVERPAR